MLILCANSRRPPAPRIVLIVLPKLIDLALLKLVLTKTAMENRGWRLGAVSWGLFLERCCPGKIALICFEGGQQTAKGAPPVALQLLFL